MTKMCYNETSVDAEFQATLEETVASMKAAGCKPYDQLHGYVTKGKEEYITRSGGAREKIKKLNWLQKKVCGANEIIYNC